jgi:ferritin-like metal-binding protein YciE
MIYCAKSHLLERLPEIEDGASFVDLKQAITETIEDVARQLVRIDEIFLLLNCNSSSSIAECSGLIGLVDDAFVAIQQQGSESEIRDLSILFYMHNIESMEMASFQVLQIAAAKMRNKAVSQLLKENFDEASADRALFQIITKKYIQN